jgi:hyperosmotically inducible protein
LEVISVETNCTNFNPIVSTVGTRYRHNGARLAAYRTGQLRSHARDRAPGAMTAGQQSNAKSDVEITREIRRAVVKDHSLSMLAHNVKIVSANGNVTLRGPVKTEEEKTAIASKAQAIAGAGKVNDQLEVKGQ